MTSLVVKIIFNLKHFCYRFLTDTNDLVIEKATEFDSGLFTCNATSALGSAEKNFSLSVYGS